MKTSFVPRAIAFVSVATSLSFGSPLSANAADETQQLPPVTVSATPSAQPVRLDVRAACPGIDAALATSLSPAWKRLQTPTIMRVKFKVQGEHVVDVSTSTNAGDYRRFVRNAVGGLACTDASSSPQSYSFLLVIHGPEDRADEAHFALLED